MKEEIKERFAAVKRWLGSLGFRTGLVVGALCVVFYVVSFAQMALPISPSIKGALWVVFFGLAKTALYTALLILGKEGLRRLSRLWSRPTIR